MKRAGSAIVVRALEDEDIGFAFGIPGTHNLELYDALAESETVRTVLVTDEQSASFMADGAWRASGRMACVNLVPGAGLTHALSGIAEAFLDHVPMLVLSCGVRRDLGKAYQLHDVDQTAMARPVTKAVFRPQRGEDLYASVRLACRLAREGAPGPVMVEVPAELYLQRCDPCFEQVPPPAQATPVMESDVERAALLLAAADRPLLYFGAGAAGAGEDLVRLAERLEAPVATTFQGKGVFPESHALFLWPGFGASAPPFARHVAAECDATLAIGCRFGEVATGSYGLQPRRPLIHVDVDPSAFNRNHAASAAIAADASAFVSALLERLRTRRADDALRRRIREGHSAVRDEQLRDGADGVNPHRLLQALQQQLGRDAVYTTDSGNGTFLAMEGLRLDRTRSFLAPVDYSCMGYAVPAAIGASLARPDRPVAALAGDGAFLMTGLELLTAAHAGAPVLVFVLRDGQLAQIAQFQKMALGRRSASVLPDYDLVGICHGVGVECLPLDGDEDIDAVVDRARRTAAAGRPVVVDVRVDYSRKTWFTRGVVATNLGRMAWGDRLRYVGRALARRAFAHES